MGSGRTDVTATDSSEQRQSTAGTALDRSAWWYHKARQAYAAADGVLTGFDSDDDNGQQTPISQGPEAEYIKVLDVNDTCAFTCAVYSDLYLSVY